MAFLEQHRGKSLAHVGLCVTSQLSRKTLFQTLLHCGFQEKHEIPTFWKRPYRASFFGQCDTLVTAILDTGKLMNT